MELPMRQTWEHQQVAHPPLNVYIAALSMSGAPTAFSVYATKAFLNSSGTKSGCIVMGARATTAATTDRMFISISFRATDSARPPPTDAPIKKHLDSSPKSASRFS